MEHTALPLLDVSALMCRKIFVMSDRADQIQMNKINTESPTIHSAHPSDQFWEAHPMVQSRRQMKI